MSVPKYEVIIYWSQEDQAFIAEVPELPGCAGDGKTYLEALANAEVVIQEWIETAKQISRLVPKPKGRLVFAQPLQSLWGLRCGVFAQVARPLSYLEMDASAPPAGR